MSDGLQPIPLNTIEAASANPYPIESLSPRMREPAEAIAERVQAPLALAGQTILGAAAHMAQTRVNAPHLHNPDGMPSSLYTLTLGMSGDRKSGCRQLAYRSLDAVEKSARSQAQLRSKEILAEADFLKGQARVSFLLENQFPVDPCSLYTDATFESLVGEFIRGKSAASWDTDEGGQVLGGASLKSDTRVAIIGGLCKAFDDGRFERMRVRSNLEGSGYAYNRRLTINLMAQQVAVASALSDPIFLGQGFLARFLLSSPESIAGTRFLDEEKLISLACEDSVLKGYWLHCDRIIASPDYVDPMTGEVVPPVVELDARANRIWLEFYNEIEEEQGPLGKFASLRAFAGRAGELARRISAVMSCFEGQAYIDADCMRRACNLVRYSLNEWGRYISNEQVDPAQAQALKLLEWLRDPRRAGSWKEFHRDLLGKSGPALLRKKNIRDQVLAILTKHRYLLTTDSRTFRLNPLAEGAEAAESPVAEPSGAADALRASADSPLSALLRKLTADGHVL